MARDADGNYYYDAGTVNEQFDNVAVTEDADGNLSMTVSGDEMRVQEFAHIFGGQRADPTVDELSGGEVMLYHHTSGALRTAYHDGGDPASIVTNDVVADVTA